MKQNIRISVQLNFRNKTVFGLFTVTVTINSVAVFLVRTHFQNGFLCDFIALLQSCFSRLLLII
jgi:hypothetical protein